MATLSLLPFCFCSSSSSSTTSPSSSSSLGLTLHPFPSRASTPHSLSTPSSSSSGGAVAGFRRRREAGVCAGGNSRNEPADESMFVDENGVVDDMDGYLNYLSPEYESVWDTKPSWCQPWTITLTGVLAIAFSWVILRSVLVTTIIGLLICLWWYIFLYSYPKAYTDMIAERRKRIRSGVEDTFGFKKAQ
ncbi:uncharacterized protein LOC116187007 [Punica granatum]|uniref:Uncharacterized protein LOC116187007 n=2 Tax=Punica granatum TaxID=22663 RepID=A0A6P8BM97_PUNGR|nr:uncharacterized protein LOC116187007 [Punica granatum]